MGPSPKGSWRGNWNQKSWQRTVRQMDHMWLPVIGRLDCSSHFCGHPKADPFLPGALDTGHGALSSSPSIAGKALHALQAWPRISSETRLNEPTDLGTPFFLFWKAFFSLSLLTYSQILLSYVYSCHFIGYKAISYILAQTESDTSLKGE